MVFSGCHTSTDFWFSISAQGLNFSKRVLSWSVLGTMPTLLLGKMTGHVKCKMHFLSFPREKCKLFQMLLLICRSPLTTLDMNPLFSCN